MASGKFRTKIGEKNIVATGNLDYVIEQRGELLNAKNNLTSSGENLELFLAGIFAGILGNMFADSLMAIFTGNGVYIHWIFLITSLTGLGYIYYIIKKFVARRKEAAEIIETLLIAIDRLSYMKKEKSKKKSRRKRKNLKAK